MFRDNPVLTRIESVIAPMLTLCPGNPKIMRKQDRQNEKIKYLFAGIDMHKFLRYKLNLLKNTILNIDFYSHVNFLLIFDRSFS
jgi:hypothetical protein